MFPSNVAYSSCMGTTKKVVHPLETKDVTGTHVDTLSNTHKHQSAEVCCHTPLINSYLSAGSPYRIGPLKGDSFPMTDKGSLGDTEDP